MTPRQKLALLWPCARAHDTVQGQFFALHREGSSLLTVNK